MFLFKASRYLEELNKFRPDIHAACVDAIKGLESEWDFPRISKEVFAGCSSNSIDDAVMEQTEDAVLVSMDLGWSDIGSWSSL